MRLELFFFWFLDRNFLVGRRKSWMTNWNVRKTFYKLPLAQRTESLGQLPLRESCWGSPLAERFSSPTTLHCHSLGSVGFASSAFICPCSVSLVMGQEGEVYRTAVPGNHRGCNDASKPVTFPSTGNYKLDWIQHAFKRAVLACVLPHFKKNFFNILFELKEIKTPKALLSYSSLFSLVGLHLSKTFVHLPQRLLPFTNLALTFDLRRNISECRTMKQMSRGPILRWPLSKTM